MKLNKRNCDIRIRLTPCGADFQKIQWSIGGDHHILWPSAVMGGQFSDLVTAVYCLYSEGYDTHTNCRRSIRQYQHDWESENAAGTDHHTIITKIQWDEERGGLDDICLTRRCKEWNYPTPDQYDPVEVELQYRRGDFKYTIDARDLCYAIAKAATKALKKYGFRGYHSSSGSCECFGDSINIEQLLFIKAYALNVLEVRELKTVWKKPKGWMSAAGTSFEDEIELLLFDM